MQAAIWGPYGGRFVPETLMAPLDELTAAYLSTRADSGFKAEFESLLRDYSGRPTPLFHAARLTNSPVGRAFISSAKTFHTPVRTKITTPGPGSAGAPHG